MQNATAGRKFTLGLLCCSLGCSGNDSDPAGNDSSPAGNGIATTSTAGVATGASPLTGSSSSASSMAGASASTGSISGTTVAIATSGTQSQTASGGMGDTAGLTTGAINSTSDSNATATGGDPTSSNSGSTGAGGAAGAQTATQGTGSGSETSSSDGSTGTGTTGTPPTTPLAVYLAGDSIVQTYDDTASTTDQAGWGQMFGDYFNELVTIHNRAIGGRTARRFIDEGRLEEIADDLEAGDYLFVQFGTNDGHPSATYTINGQTIPYYLDPATDFKTYLTEYINLAREKSATPVLVTPTPRNSAYCTGGNGTSAHAAAMRELAAAEGVALSDLNAKTVDYLMAICPSPTPEDFFFVRGDGSVDGTHFQENGARILAGFVAEGVQEAQLSLARYLK